MNDSNSQYELIEKYCFDLMDERERFYFEQEIAKNAALKDAVEEFYTLIKTFDHIQSKNFVSGTLEHIHKHSRSQTEVLLNSLKLHVNKYWKTASVAASVAFVASMLTFAIARSVYKKDSQAQYTILKREINNIKEGQKAIKKDIAQVKKSNVPSYPSKAAGSGFALSQKGYVVTNLHVVDGYDKIFVFTSDNVGHQSEVVATDAQNDLAILKITESDFSFKSRIPYALRKTNPNIAQRIFSLGYPKDDIVYNEGYISSVTGFESDSNKFQLELPSGPGVSGAPILDEFGHVVGIISGKQSLSNGITYAIKTKSLMNLVKALPDDFKLAELSNNSLKGKTRSEQVKQIQPYICVVKVYN